MKQTKEIKPIAAMGTSYFDGWYILAVDDHNETVTFCHFYQNSDNHITCHRKYTRPIITVSADWSENERLAFRFRGETFLFDDFIAL